MPKKKISKKRAKSSSEKSQTKSYRPGTDVSIDGLKAAITEALFDADFDTFKGCIAILLNKFDYRDITKSTGLSKSTLYRMSEPTANPTLENVCKVLNFIRELDVSDAA